MTGIRFLTDEEFEKLCKSKDVDSKFAEMNYMDQKIFLVRMAAKYNPDFAGMSADELISIVSDPEYKNKIVLQEICAYMRPSDLKNKKMLKTVGTVLFGNTTTAEIYETDKNGYDYVDAARHMTRTIDQLKKTRKVNAEYVRSQDEKIIWNSKNFKASEWFEDPQKYKDCLTESGLPIAKDPEAVRTLFMAWLMCEKKWSLQEAADDSLSTPEQKKSLGAEFLETIAKKKVFGPVADGGGDKVRENIHWYSNLYDTALWQIRKEKIVYPRKMLSEKEFTELKDSKIGFAMGLAHGMLDQIQRIWMNPDNRINKSNNYGVNFETTFVEGLGGVEAAHAGINDLKVLASVEQVRRNLERLSERTDANIAAKAYTLMEGFYLYSYANIQIKKRVDPEGDHMLLCAKNAFESAESLQRDNKSSEAVDSACKDILKGKYDKNNKVVKKIISYLEIDNAENQVSGQDHLDQIEEAVNCVNSNHNNVVYDIPDIMVGEGKKFRLQLYEIEMGGLQLSEEETMLCLNAFDQVFEPIILREQAYLKKNGLQPEDYLNSFTIGGESAVKLATEKLKSKMPEEMAPPAAEINTMAKLLILNAMVTRDSEKDKELEYVVKAKLTEENKDISKVLKINKPTNYRRIDYDKLDDMQKGVQDLITGCGTIRVIDVWYHHNSRDFRNMCDELNKLSAVMSGIELIDQNGEVRKDTDADMIRAKEQMERTMKAINNYENKRRGTKNSISKSRLNALKPLKKTLALRMEKYKAGLESQKKAPEKASAGITR